MFWLPMIINEYTPEFQFTKSSKDAKFVQCLYLKSPPPVMSRTDAQNALYSFFKAWSHSVRYTTRILSYIINNYWMRFIVICRIINAEVRVISRAEGEGDNSYLNIDNFAYHNKHIYIYNIAFLNSER